MHRWRLGICAALFAALLGATLWVGLVLASSGAQAGTPAIFQGPADGTSPSGILTNTVNFTNAPVYDGDGSYGVDGVDEAVRTAALESLKPLSVGDEPAVHSSVEPGSNEVDDAPPGSDPSPSPHFQTLDGFAGLPDEADPFNLIHIPPDPIMAAGPDHLVGAVNTEFGFRVLRRDR